MSLGHPVVTVTLNPAIDQTLSIPRFAAGQVNRVAASREDAGGKGVNVACFLADLGVEVTATGFLGAKNASLFEAALTRRGIADGFVLIAGSTRIGIKIVDEQAGRTTDINFPGLTPSRGDLQELRRRIDAWAALAGAGGWFVLSGSVPPGVPDDIYANLIETIHGMGGRVVLDTSGRPLEAALASVPDVMKPNLDELRELVGGALETPASVASVRAAARSLLERGCKLVVVSIGAEGAVFVDREGALFARPPRVAVESTVGAGDAMVGGIVHALLHGLPLADLARTATASGAYAVTRIGRGIADRAAYERLRLEVEIEELP